VNSMFEHLDDPAPPFVGLTARDAVAERVARRRAARRTRQRRVLVASLGVIVLAAATAVAATRSTGSLRPAATTTTAADSPSLPVPPGSVPDKPDEPLTVVSDLDFTTPTDGWLLGRTCGDEAACKVVLRTRDGGRTWSQLSGGPPGDPNRISVGGDGTIYAFGAGLSVSHDGGASWDSELGDGKVKAVLDVEPEGTDVWALTVSVCATPCPGAIWRSADAGRTWRSEPLPASGPGADGQLVRQGGGQAWRLGVEEDETTFLLEHTDDDGITWSRLAFPCDPVTTRAARLAVVDAAHLWLACGADNATAQQGKQVFRSSSGGTQWTQAADPGLLGHLSGIAAADAERAFLALGRNTMLATLDGGQSWQEAIPYDSGNPTDAGIAPVHFVDPRHGWALGADDTGAPVLWRTDDAGATWSPVPLG